MTQGYSDYVEKPQVDADQIEQLVEKQREEEAEVERIEGELREAKARLSNIAERELPDLMEQMGITEFVTAKGYKIQVKKTFRCSVAGDNKAQALQWLKDHGHGAIIKNMVAVPFAVGQDEKAQELAQELRQRFGDAAQEAKVEPQTLKALLTRLMQQGEDVPLDTFKGFEQKQANITVKK